MVERCKEDYSFYVNYNKKLPIDVVFIEKIMIASIYTKCDFGIANLTMVAQCSIRIFQLPEQFLFVDISSDSQNFIKKNLLKLYGMLFSSSFCIRN